MNDKHAYLIIAHNEFNLLKILLEMIDYEKNDIYIHVDKKIGDFDKSQFYNSVKKSRLYFIDERINVKWGEFSQIKCELKLFEEATACDKYMYYHLISGVDLPLKDQDTIHNFFKINNGKEFVHFDSSLMNISYKKRVSKYYFKCSKNENLIYKSLNKVSLIIQYFINRTSRINLEFQKGCNWCSITHELVNYILAQKKLIYKVFKYSLCGDEMFIQTLVWNSYFKSKLYSTNYEDNYKSICRLIDWKRGNPYVFKLCDFEELIESDMIFARKFSYTDDREVILKLKDYILNRDKK